MATCSTQRLLRLAACQARPTCNPGHRTFATTAPPPTSAEAQRAAATSSSSSSSETSNPAPGPPKPNVPFTVFDRDVKRAQRSRAFADAEKSRQTDYIRTIAAETICERLLDIKRKFPTIVELGAGPGYVRQFIDAKATGTERIIMCDTSQTALDRDRADDGKYAFQLERRLVDEEQLPFEENSLDCIISSGTLHWTNDLPGALIQIQRALKPDGVFLGVIYGGDTLFELRASMQMAEQEREGGISPRISPMADTRDVVSLLVRAGFNIPAVDTDDIEICYPSAFELVRDLHDMGESNAVLHRRPMLQRDTLLAASAIYSDLYGDGNDGISALFQLIYMTGWKADASQRKPLPRGTATHSMKDALG